MERGTKYTKKTANIPFDEFFSESSLAYVLALESFDETKGCSLITHLCCQMEYACCHFIESEYASHVSVNNIARDKVVQESTEEFNKNASYIILSFGIK